MSKKGIKVSVVVAAYNEEKYIGHTLESVISQKVDFDYEILVGDDCSSDGTAAVIREYAKKYPDIVVPFIREKNLGMTGNSLDLINRAQGEYIALVEGDDYWIDENKLQKQVTFLDANKEYVACFGLCIIVDEMDIRHRELEQQSGFLKKGGDYTVRDFEEYLLPGQTATSMYRTAEFHEMFNQLMNSDFDMSRFIDRHMVLMMMARGKLYNSGEEIAAYRYVMKKSSGSWSSKNDYYSIENLMNYLEGLKDLEKIGKYLGIMVDFDQRRKYEWEKLQNNIDMFSKEDARLVKRTLLQDCNDISNMKMFGLKSELKCIKKSICNYIKHIFMEEK